MALGYYDPNGVWINGEDDAYATFSERMNKSPESISELLGPLLERQPMTKFAVITSAQVPTGTTLGTIVVPRKSFTQRVSVDIAGVGGFDVSDRVFAVALAASAGGTVTETEVNQVRAQAGQFAAYSRRAYVDIAVGTGDVTLTLTSSANGSIYYRIVAEARIIPAGQF